MKKLTVFSVALSATFVTGPVLAGQYELIKGKGVQLCEAYHQNLEIVMKKEEEVCDREFGPDFPEFKKPEWKELDVWENRELLNKVDKYLDYGDQFAKDKIYDDKKEFENIVKSQLELEAIYLRVAQVDIDNDGVKDNILKYENGKCGIARFVYGIAMLALTEQQDALDVKKTRLLIQNTYINSATGKEKTSPTAWLYNMYDTFFYKDDAYFDKGDMRGGGYLALSVYKASNKTTTKICQLKYNR